MRPAPLIASTRNDQNPHYSPDGQQIAFESNRSGTETIWLCDADGSNPRKLVDEKGKPAGTPRWSPDGRKIAFDWTLSGTLAIYVVNAEGGAPVRLTNGAAGEGVPFWSGDGKWLYFTSKPRGTFQIWKTPAEPKGTAIQVTRNGGDEAFEARDGFLYFTKNGPSVGHLWLQSLGRIPLAGGEESEVVKTLSWRSSFVVEQGVYFILPSNRYHAFSLEFLNFTTGKTQTIASVDGLPGEGMAVSPDRRFLLYSRSPEPDSDLMLVENFQ
jgi:hypothetical protein